MKYLKLFEDFEEEDDIFDELKTTYFYIINFFKDVQKKYKKPAIKAYTNYYKILGFIHDIEGDYEEWESMDSIKYCASRCEMSYTKYLNIRLNITKDYLIILNSGRKRIDCSEMINRVNNLILKVEQL